MDAFTDLVRALSAENVRYVVIGVWGANFFALGGGTVFTTNDRDLFLPPDPDNLVACWRACEQAGLSLWSGGEPLDVPRDRWLAERIVERQSLVRATDDRELFVDLTLVMAGFDFETVWQDHRVFASSGVQLPVARLLHIVRSKQAAGREKDRLFLATHREALQELLRKD